MESLQPLSIFFAKITQISLPTGGRIRNTNTENSESLHRVNLSHPLASKIRVFSTEKFVCDKIRSVDLEL